MASSLAASFGACARALAQRDCLRTAIAVEQYRLDHGALPESLDVLTPKYIEAVPVDPFDGHTIRYRLTDTGFMVYSVGDNRVDDGGVDDMRTGDVVFTVKR